MDLIIGAGITGLSYASFTSRECLIVEATDSPGGYCKTIKRNGFVWDYSGHFFHFRYPEIKKFIFENLDSSDLIEVEKITQILYNGKYIDFPFQKNIHQLEKQEFIDCLYDLFNPITIEKASSFKEMLYSKLGKSISDKFLIPYNEKLYACNLDILDVDAMGRFFPKASPIDIVKNFKSSDNESYNSNFTYPKGGAIQYVDSILKGLKCEIKYNTIIEKIDRGQKIAYTQNGQAIEYDNLISTIPFPRLLDVTGLKYPPNLFTCNKVLVYNMGFDKKGPDISNCWVYIPSKDYIFYRVGYYDNIMKTERCSIYIEIGFSEKDPLPDIEDFKNVVLEDLIKAGIIDTTYKLIDYEAVVMDPAYVHITRRSIEKIREFKDILAKNDIYSIGRYGSWTYCSIEDNIIEARDLALKLNE